MQLLSINDTSKFSGVWKIRDLSVIDLIGNISMIIACDLNASIQMGVNLFCKFPKKYLPKSK